MANIIRSKKEEEKQELEQNKLIKPKLRKFLIDEQRKGAEKAAKEKQKEDELLLKRNDVLQRASQLATMALLRDKIWQKFPPLLDMAWTRATTNDPKYAQEMHGDISGFALYLVREYNNYFKFGSLSKGYPDPMVEDNLEFFWNKFNADLKLLIEAEKRRVAAGNTSLIISQMPKKTEIIVPGEKKSIN